MIKYKDDTYIIVSRTTIICVRNQFCEKIQIQRYDLVRILHLLITAGLSLVNFKNVYYFKPIRTFNIFKNLVI